MSGKNVISGGRRAALAVVVVIATLATTALGLYGYLVWTPAPAVPVLSGQVFSTSLAVGDRERSYTAYVPARLAPGAPLLVVLHGSFEDGAAIRRNTGYGFDVLADRHGFAVAYPDGYEQGWNDCRRVAATPARRENVDDAGFVRALVADLHGRHGVDDTRFFAAGYSNGGQMVFRLASEMPDRLAGIAAVSANLPVAEDSSCAPMTTSVPVLTMAGTADPISPFRGGEVTIFGFSPRGRVMSADDTARTFVRVNGMTGAPVARALAHRDGATGTVVREAVYREPGKAPVVQYTIEGGGHVIPTEHHRYARIMGPTSHDLDAPTAIWDFFASATGIG
ncbi:polyhydroxybutyrate depolymerase [Lentzea xinjiangensis]|uniref:Polyhydroxybutyrate depolymerase n=1 Tax=Lentzea xinjiangensis TaxID=402600 RepID=A0A1H9NLJ4_9PSEU|nr:PHB depolymerase family esterase [Lentzea xinjiangensis]SER36786.1 polyhydroxybutyrate depolymerase [Lentzea xinjiangensis]